MGIYSIFSCRKEQSKLQDIEICGTKDDDVKPEELIGEEKKILRMLERK
jgi:hypothetical protein